jgi:hypothetical protein
MISHGLLKVAATAAIWTVSLNAMADVTYSYTGKSFKEVHAQFDIDGDSAQELAAKAAAAEATLRTKRLKLSLVSPVYMPAGWSNFSSTGAYGGAVAAPLQSLADKGIADPGISWNVQTSLFSGNGHISLAFDGASFDWANASRVTVSVHVGAGHQIDAWTLSMEPGYGAGALLWVQQLSSSNTGGDSVLFENGSGHYFEHQDAASLTPGTWAVSGSPLLPVPEAPASAMLLAGLAGIGLLRWRRTSA